MTPKKVKQKTVDLEEEGFDYQELFADDEEVVLGIEDKDEAKEASKRVLGRAGQKINFDDDEEEVEKTYKSAAVKVGGLM